MFCLIIHADCRMKRIRWKERAGIDSAAGLVSECMHAIDEPQRRVDRGPGPALGEVNILEQTPTPTISSNAPRRARPLKETQEFASAQLVI